VAAGRRGDQHRKSPSSPCPRGADAISGRVLPHPHRPLGLRQGFPSTAGRYWYWPSSRWISGGPFTRFAGPPRRGTPARACGLRHCRRGDGVAEPACFRDHLRPRSRGRRGGSSTRALAELRLWPCQGLTCKAPRLSPRRRGGRVQDSSPKDLSSRASSSASSVSWPTWPSDRAPVGVEIVPAVLGKSITACAVFASYLRVSSSLEARSFLSAFCRP